MVEAKRTETGRTKSTTWLAKRDQPVRHIDAAFEMRGRKNSAWQLLNIYEMTVEQLPVELRKKITVLPGVDDLHRAIAGEFADLLYQKTRQEEMLTMIASVGPLNYLYFAEKVARRGLSCRNLRIIRSSYAWHKRYLLRGYLQAC